jgi:WD40 repeat protein
LTYLAYPPLSFPKTSSARFGDVQSVAFSPDGRRLASVGERGGVRLYDLTTGEEILSLAGRYRDLAFRRDTTGPVF